MSVPAPLVASVRARLFNGSRERGEEFQGTLLRYAIERLLYRLSQSPHRDEFILKGAALYAVWMDEAEVTFRPTRDLDLLGAGEPSGAAMTAIFRSVIALNVEPDGLEFDADALRATEMREDELYRGCRLNLMAYLGAARIPLQVDIGFGDAVTPQAREGAYPTLLDLPAPHLKFYPRETVIAEKFEAMVALGAGNSRMKDFFDIWLLCQRFEFDGRTLAAALKATFARRETPLPSGVPLALTSEFTDEEAKVAAWRSFVKRNALEVPELAIVAGQIQTFLMPIALALNAQAEFGKHWQVKTGWGERGSKEAE